MIITINEVKINFQNKNKRINKARNVQLKNKFWDLSSKKREKPRIKLKHYKKCIKYTQKNLNQLLQENEYIYTIKKPY